MRVARYVGGGQVSIVDEPRPECPPGGLLVQTEACGLCSGELMAWYMDQKIPHVLGHEVSGCVVESQDARFPQGSRLFPHHHAPCMECDYCLSGRHVHCAQWRRTKLAPGGMADYFGVSRENLSDALATDDLRPVDAALVEPLACVIKAIELAGDVRQKRVAVIGLGTMGLLHMLALLGEPRGYDLNPKRVEWARSLGLAAHTPDQLRPAEVVFVCPGSQSAFDSAVEIAAPLATLVLFAPLGPGEALSIPQSAYFKDLRIVHSYSCGPTHTLAAASEIRRGTVQAEQVCSHFISLDELPEKYLEMKRGAILKPMVVWS